MTVRVGLLDSGAGLAVGPALVADRAFQLDGSGKVIARESQNPANDHGSQLAELLLDVPEPVGLLSANVFTGGQVSSPTVIAAGLNWLVENGAQVVNMSFGLANDRPVLSEACHNADRENVILVAAGPARGEPVYPAAYPDVLAITGDARCTSEELSRQPSAHADFGACVHVPGAEPGVLGSSGASVAVAHVTRAVCRYLSGHPNAPREDVIDHLADLCRYHGAERRTR